MTPSRRALLVELFTGLFTDAELRRFVGTNWPALARDLPGAGASPHDLADAAAGALQRRGLAGAGLHERLLAERPGRRSDIDAALAEGAGVQRDHPSHGPAPTAPVQGQPPGPAQPQTQQRAPDPQQAQQQGNAPSVATCPLRILHLSDLHFDPAHTWDQDPVRRALVRAVAAFRGEGRPLQLVVVTGDIVARGQAAAYPLAERWLRDQLLPAAGLDPDHLLLIPGNHDVDRRAVDFVAEAVQDKLLAAKSQDAIANVLNDTSRRATLLARHAEYQAFANRLRPRDAQLDVPWWSTTRVLPSGLRVHFAGLDSAWMACSENDQGKLLVGRWQAGTLLQPIGPDPDLTVALIHHPLELLAHWDASAVRELVYAHCGLLLQGHQHVAEAAVHATTVNQTLIVAAGACYDDSPFYRGFNLLELDPFAGRARIYPFTWRGADQAWIPDCNVYGADGVAELPLRKSRRGPPWAPPGAQGQGQQQLQGPERGSPPAITSGSLASLKSQVRARANRLPDVFRREGGPGALSEVYVEVKLCGEPRQHGCDRETFWGPLWHKLRDRGCTRLPAKEAGEAEDDADGCLPGQPFPLRAVLDLPHPCWVLLGDPGCGKTWLLHNLAMGLLEEGDRIPLLLKVAEIHPGEGLLATAGRVYGQSCVEQLRDEVSAGRCAVLLDGLDEVLDPNAAGGAVRRVASDAGPCPVIVASRPTGFRAPSDDFVTLTVCPLDDEAQLELLTTWTGDASRATAALARMGRKPRLRRLAANPLLLTLAGLILRTGRDIPERRGELYDNAVHILLHRGAGADRPGRLVKEPDVVLATLGWLALRLHGDQGEVYPIAHMRTTLAEHPRAEQQVERIWGGLTTFLAEVAEVTGLLVPDEGDPTRARGYHFPHRTFREYLAATALVLDMAEQGIGRVPPEAIQGAARDDRATTLPPAPGELGRILTDARARPAIWSEVLALSIGLQGDKAGDALMRRIAAEGSAELTQRVVAEAEGLPADTVLAVLGMDPGPGAWEARRDVLQGLPDIVKDLAVTVGIAWRFAQGTTNGNDLFFARELLRRVASGAVEGAVAEGSADAVRKEAEVQAGRILDHLDAGRREQARDEVRRWARSIPAGSFMMGSPEGEEGRWKDEGPQHRVEILQGFKLVAVPVTHALFELFDPDHGALRDTFEGKVPVQEQDGHPVYNVSWYEAVMFSEWVGGRLPLEAEWEYACRAGSETRYCSGDSEADLAAVGWYDGNSGGHTHPVAEKPANPWGLHDMHGNVWEWCADPWRADYSGDEAGVRLDPGAAPPAADPGLDRVVRGGSWSNSARVCRSAYRYLWNPRYQWLHLGFRVLLPPSPSSRP